MTTEQLQEVARAEFDHAYDFWARWHSAFGRWRLREAIAQVRLAALGQ